MNKKVKGTKKRVLESSATNEVLWLSSRLGFVYICTKAELDPRRSSSTITTTSILLGPYLGLSLNHTLCQ